MCDLVIENSPSVAFRSGGEFPKQSEKGMQEIHIQTASGDKWNDVDKLQ